MAIKSINIFRAGRHVASNGTAIDFTAADLAASAAAYDPAKHEAPLVIGHPTHDAPAYGWTQSLAFADGNLNAVPQQVDAQFAEMHAAGRFKKVSASFYTPDSPGNPVPGVYYLRHIGFLGAQPPAIKGLKAAQFADGETFVEFADWSDTQNASLWRRLRDWIIGKEGLDEADKVIPDYAVASLEDAARKETAAATPAMNYHEPKETDMTAVNTAEQSALAAREAQITADRAALDAQRAEFTERETRVAAAELAARRTAIAEFVEGLIKAGKLLPRDQAGLLAYMAGPNESGVIEFSEGEEKKSVRPDAWLKRFLEGLPKQVDYAERSGGDLEKTTVNFAAPPGYAVDLSRLEIHHQALAYQAAHAGTDYTAALAAVNR